MEPEVIVRELYDAFNERDFERVAAAFAEPCEYESIASASVMRTGADVAEGLRAWASAFPDGFVEMTNLIAVGPWLVVGWHAQGTQTGPLCGEPPADGGSSVEAARSPRSRRRRSFATVTTSTARRCTSRSG